jgi:NAD(P)-dependent dehydrogenase (short-subunit alcohol dehydrogenase family)
VNVAGVLRGIQAAARKFRPRKRKGKGKIISVSSIAGRSPPSFLSWWAPIPDYMTGQAPLIDGGLVYR